MKVQKEVMMKSEKKAIKNLIEELLEEPVILYDEDDNEFVFETVAVINLEEDGNLYFLVTPTEASDDFHENEIIVMKFDADDEDLIIVLDEEIIDKVSLEYEKLVKKEQLKNNLK